MGVDFNSEPSQAFTDSVADDRRILTNASGEDQRVQAAKRSSERANLADRAIDEIINRDSGPLVIAGEQLADVIADAGDAEQTGLPVEQFFDLLAAVLLQEEKYDARVQTAA